MTLQTIEENEQIALTELTPREKVSQGKEWSSALMEVVEQRELFTERNGKKYLHVEAWELIGAFAGLRAETEEVDEVLSNGEVIGYKAKVVLFNKETNEKEGGGGISFCGMDEFVTLGQKSVGGKHNAAMSMAQTRAVSKAYRMNYSWVAVLGDYQPTPWEEMEGMEKKGGNTQTVPRQEVITPSNNSSSNTPKFWCEIHETEMTQSEKQKARDPNLASHRIGNTGDFSQDYCNGGSNNKPRSGAEKKTDLNEADPDGFDDLEVINAAPTEPYADLPDIVDQKKFGELITNKFGKEDAEQMMRRYLGNMTATEWVAIHGDKGYGYRDAYVLICERYDNIWEL